MKHKNKWKWRNLHRWQKFYTATGSDGMDKFHLCALFKSNGGYDIIRQTRRRMMVIAWNHIKQSYWVRYGKHLGVGYKI